MFFFIVLTCRLRPRRGLKLLHLKRRRVADVPTYLIIIIRHCGKGRSEKKYQSNPAVKIWHDIIYFVNDINIVYGIIIQYNTDTSAFFSYLRTHRSGICVLR